MSTQHEVAAGMVERVAEAIMRSHFSVDWRLSEVPAVAHVFRHDALAALRALRDAGALVGPDQVAVPREATKEMITAALDRPPEHEGEMMYGGIYRAMLAAAPRAGGGDE